MPDLFIPLKYGYGGKKLHSMTGVRMKEAFL